MDRKVELQAAWILWHILRGVKEQLWQRYEDGFLQFCIDEEYPDYAKPRHEHSAKE